MRQTTQRQRSYLARFGREVLGFRKVTAQRRSLEVEGRMGELETENAVLTFSLVAAIFTIAIQHFTR
jgi:hypothetical protein